MKKILLSSAALTLLAGAAAAEITWSGSATIGYNDDYSDGVFVDSDVDINATAELNNGWTASLTYGIELDNFDNNGATDNYWSEDENLTISVSNDMYTLTYGDTEYAAVSYWNGVSDMAFDGFSEVDDEQVLKLDAKFDMFSAGLSTAVDRDGQTYQLGFGATATLGMVDLSVAYQEEDAAPATGDIAANGDYNGNEIFGISAGTSFGGADILVAYAKDNTADEDSIGIQVSYPVGPVTLTGYYVSESVASATYGDDYTYGLTAAYADGPIEILAHYESARGEEEYNLEGSYDFGMGLVVTAGYIDGDDDTDNDFASYIVAEYDLGGGASFLASYADANSTAAEMTDDIDTGLGGYELYSGATLALSLSF
ncbi:porin [Celeribacter neptunius]|uniref:Porin n=1 Tax=Celeribacter neptunius TaxID=588602 RepID=A0A1I3S2Q3_9RHOB|nr:porin [Celeribacter neptunius]SFJ52352.1 porin [Celeribacter neptunius]